MATLERAGPRFTRELPQVRRRALIEATAASLAELGAATSVRSIASRAGVSIGLIRHHFGGVDALIAETYRTTGERVAAHLAAVLEAAPGDPEVRLKIFVDASFRAPLIDADLLAVWLAFWSLVRRDPEIRRVHGEIYAGYRERIEAMLVAAGAARGLALDGRLAALALTSMLDGLWLELCLDPTTFTPDEAVAMALAWVEACLAGAMPRLLDAAAAD